MTPVPRRPGPGAGPLGGPGADPERTRSEPGANPDQDADRDMYGRDAGASRFSPLKQVNISNINKLSRAWTFHTGKPGSESVPIVVNGVMYLAAANGIFAIEPVELLRAASLLDSSETGRQRCVKSSRGLASCTR